MSMPVIFKQMNTVVTAEGVGDRKNVKATEDGIKRCTIILNRDQESVKSEESVFEETMTEKCSNGESNGKIKTPKHVTVKPWMKR